METGKLAVFIPQVCVHHAMSQPKCIVNQMVKIFVAKIFDAINFVASHIICKLVKVISMQPAMKFFRQQNFLIYSSMTGRYSMHIL